jgi:predicted amidohydrolase
VYLSLGGFQQKSVQSKLKNTHLLISPLGNVLDLYDKAHLFDVCLDNGISFKESAFTEAGDRIVVVDTELGSIGLSVCFDIRFSHLYALQRSKGAQILLIPAAFTVPTGSAHWEVLLRARAM